MNGIPYVLQENMRLTRSEIPMLIIRLSERRVGVSMASRYMGEHQDDDDDEEEEQDDKAEGVIVFVLIIVIMITLIVIIFVIIITKTA